MRHGLQTRNDIGRHRGFTLVELLVVLAIIALLASLAAPVVTNSVDRAKEAALKEDLFVLRKALDDHYADKGAYPQELTQLVELRYIRRMPVDPITGHDDTWVVIRDDKTPGQSGIVDVRSGSEEKSSTGEAYRDW